MAVEPSFQGSGYGQQFLEEILKRIPNQTVVLTTQ
ncbi:hypothetical protein GLV99_15855 [Virgibacillus massiliensis]|nr:hypothetical protein [Virgibacillus massiliensis]